ncbi:hypothetical protein RDE2_14600 [Rhodococcus sp. RDE2]|nr:hypothetical protein RDE2_14600 [Rhodococcus sp. RDE2]
MPDHVEDFCDERDDRCDDVHDDDHDARDDDHDDWDDRPARRPYDDETPPEVFRWGLVLPACVTRACVPCRVRRPR